MFLARFPEEVKLYELNNARIVDFLKYTKEEGDNVQSITVEESNAIKEINDLGFITTNSQAGSFKEILNPKDVANDKGSPAKVYSDTERAYCDGFLRKELLDAFVTELKVGGKLEVVVYPRKVPRTGLTVEHYEFEDGTVENFYTSTLPSYDPPDIQDLAMDLSDSVYHVSEEEDGFPIDLEKWVLVIAYDTRWKHHALNKDGLFVRIKKALETVLSKKGGRRRRQTRRRRRA
jgi:hypothetical protein